MSVTAVEPSNAVTVFWRPGCPFCATLRWGLERAGIATTEVNIWEDPDGAATVRRVAGGNETVPTVFVGDTPLVNPSVGAVRRALRSTGVGIDPAQPDAPASSSSWLQRVIDRLAGRTP